MSNICNYIFYLSNLCVYYYFSISCHILCMSSYLKYITYIEYLYLIYRKMVVRQYQEELKYLEKINEYCWRIKKGFQPNMNVIFFSYWI